jgi:hypothetical protein
MPVIQQMHIKRLLCAMCSATCCRYVMNKIGKKLCSHSAYILLGTDTRYIKFISHGREQNTKEDKWGVLGVGMSCSFKQGSQGKPCWGTFKQRRQRVGHRPVWGNSIPDRGDSKCKCLEAGACLACLRKEQGNWSIWPEWVRERIKRTQKSLEGRV